MTARVGPSPLEEVRLARLRELQRLQQLRAARERERQERERARAREAVAPYLYDPVAWARDCIAWPKGHALADYQGEVLEAIPTRRRVAVRSPHGAGKSCVASLATLWFAVTRDAAGWDWKVPTTASAWRHLSAFLWPEIRRWARLIRWDLLGRSAWDTRRELLELNIKLRFGAASAVASNRPERIEGAHADSLLYVIDEGKTVPAGTWDAIEGAFSGGRTEGLPEAFALALSTPGHPSGRFYDIHRRAVGLEDWHPIHVTLDRAVAAGRIARPWAEQRRRQWGPDSALYHNRVLGEFWASDEDAVCPLAWVEAAVERWHEWDAAGRPQPDGRRVLGVDVARSGADKTVLAHRLAHIISELAEHHREDTMQTTARVQSALGLTDEEAAQATGAVPVVDSVGVGAGVVDRLRELRLPVLAYTGAAKSTARDRRTGTHGFANTRSAAWWNLRELLDPTFDPEIMLPPHELLLSDLTTPTWREVSGVPPKLVVEEKEAVNERLGRSTDHGDAVVMAFWAERMAGFVRTHSPTADRQQRAPGRESAAAQRYGRRALGGAPGTTRRR